MKAIENLRRRPLGDIKPHIRCKAKKDLYTLTDGKAEFHIAKDEQGEITHKTKAGFIVRFDNGELRQVFDFQGEERLYRVDDEIELT